ncbi:MAG: hypothetical protein GXW85_03895 [Clostridia bacterium]|nr:hypothetical protein [Clostridia bacterium]
MVFVLGLITLGALILAGTVSWQVKYVNPEWLSVALYNLKILPLLFTANLSLGMAFIKGNDAVKNLPMLIASQTFIYYIFILLFTIYLLGDKVSVPKALLAFCLMAISIWLLKS